MSIRDEHIFANPYEQGIIDNAEGYRIDCVLGAGNKHRYSYASWEEARRAAEALLDELHRPLMIYAESTISGLPHGALVATHNGKPTGKWKTIKELKI